MLECAKLGRCVDAQRLGAKLLQPLDRRTLRRHFTLEYFGLFRQINERIRRGTSFARSGHRNLLSVVRKREGADYNLGSSG